MELMTTLRQLYTGRHVARDQDTVFRTTYLCIQHNWPVDLAAADPVWLRKKLLPRLPWVLAVGAVIHPFFTLIVNTVRLGYNLISEVGQYLYGLVTGLIPLLFRTPGHALSEYRIAKRLAGELAEAEANGETQLRAMMAANEHIREAVANTMSEHATMVAHIERREQGKR